MFTHIKNILFAMMIAIGVAGVVPAHAATCGVGAYLASDGKTCLNCTIDVGYYCPGDDTRHLCPTDDTDWFNLTNGGVVIDQYYRAWGEGITANVRPGSVAACTSVLRIQFPQGQQYRESFWKSERGDYYTDGYWWYVSTLAPGYYGCGTIHSNGSMSREICECSNAPANAHYTGRGTPDSTNGTVKDANDCPWGCDAGYFRDGNVCRVCPADLGYSVNAAGECVTECAAAYYVPTAGAACTHVTVGGSYYVDTAHTVKYGETSTHMLKQCPATADGGRGYIPSDTTGSSIAHCFLLTYNVRYTADDRGNCVAGGAASCDYETHGVASAPCYYTTGADGSAIYDKQTRDPVTGEWRWNCVGATKLTSCDAGWYDPYDSAIMSNTPTRYAPCQPVGTGYYSPDGDLKRYPCPEKTASCGYGDCAKSIEDCKPYKTIMTSTGVSLMMQPDQRTHPALGLRMPDDGSVWYGQTDPGARNGHINIEYGEGSYALINPMDLFIDVSYAGHTFLVPERPTLPY